MLQEEPRHASSSQAGETLTCLLDRREVLRRVTVILGAAVSAPTILAIMHGDTTSWAAVPESAWQPKILTTSQTELTATLAEHIIPTTDTPGGRAAGVHRFIDAMLSDYYPAIERKQFLAGLDSVDLRAWELHWKPFMACPASQQVALLTELDREAYASQAKKPRAHLAYSVRLSRLVSSHSLTGKFWRRMKELTLVGYYTSQTGATLELHASPTDLWHNNILYCADSGTHQA